MTQNVKNGMGEKKRRSQKEVAPALGAGRTKKEIFVADTRHDARLIHYVTQDAP